MWDPRKHIVYAGVHGASGRGDHGCDHENGRVNEHGHHHFGALDQSALGCEVVSPQEVVLVMAPIVG